MKNRQNEANTFLSSSSEKKQNSVFNRRVFANIELKVPYNPEIKAKYRWQEAVNQLHALIQEKQMAEYCMVQSFDHESLTLFEQVNSDYIKTQADRFETTSFVSQSS